MPGIQRSPESDISIIRELLKIYAPGFAFLKELLQNADDAAAERLRLAWTPGLNGVKHPLLKAPALIALNDGGFTHGDRDGLMRMGLGNKGANAGKIGKFGLGTKSIFHVAEAFFFLESGQDSDLRDILNPWSPRFHQDWDQVDEADWTRLDSMCRELGEGIQSWFALWIPLRRLADLGGTVPIVNGEAAFPGDESGCPAALKAPFRHRNPRIGELLPLMRHLREVEFRTPQAEPLIFQINHEKCLIEQPGARMQVQLRSHSKPGAEEIWRSQAAWPQVFEFQEDGSEVSSPDKAEWSHSIVLTTSPTEQLPKLRIYWSVFLPVGNKPYFEDPLPSGSRDISIFLHGFFFLNSSRTEISGLGTHFGRGSQEDPVGICLNWNHDLACGSEGLLPLLLPALAAWQEDGTLLTSEIPGISNLIRNSQLWVDFRRTLTMDGALVYCLRGGNWGWRWIPADQAVVIIPKVDTAEDLRVIEKITTRKEAASNKLAFAVDFSEARALAGELLKFESSHLVELRELLGNGSELTDEEAALLARILGSVAGGVIPIEWNDIPVFRVKFGGEENWSRVTLAELDSLRKTGDLFRADEHGLAPLLADAAGDARLPAIAAHDAPILFEIQNLTYDRAAGWLLGRTGLSPTPTKRLNLLKRFAARERFGPLELKAIRYLAHACPDHRENESSSLYFPTAPQPDYWAMAYRIALDSLQESWRQIDPAFIQKMSDDLKGRTYMLGCTRENWSPFIKGVRLHGEPLDFSTAESAILDWILKETPEEATECLHHLKIHRLATGEMVAASDPKIWLDGGLEVPEELSEAWRKLRQSARILKAASNPEVHLRQKRLFSERILDHSGVLRLAVDSDDPSANWNLILHFLEGGTPRPDAIENLRKVAWLPIFLRDGADAWASPENILYLPHTEAILDNVFTYFQDPSFHSSNRVKAEVRNSKGWGILSSQIFPSHSKVFECLAQIFESAPDGLLLGFDGDLNDESLDRWLKVIGGSDDSSLFPIRPLLAQLSNTPDWKRPAICLAGALARPFRGGSAPTRYKCILSTLQEQHITSPREQATDIVTIFANYLRGARAANLWDELKRDKNLLLLSQSGNWSSPENIAPPCCGVQSKALLHAALADALNLSARTDLGSEQVHGGGLQRDASVSPEQSAANIRKALAPFPEKLPKKAVAILPALLGNEAPTVQFAKELLDGISVKSIRDELIPLELTVNDQLGGSLHARSQNWAFRVQLIEGETVTLESVAGSPFEAPLKTQSDSIFLPNPDGQMIRWCGGNLQELYVTSPARFQHLSESRLQEILLESIRNLLWWAYVHRSPDLETIFEKYANLGQLSLGVARQEILRSAETQLQLLGSRPPELEDARRSAAEAHSRFAEAEAGVGDSKRLREEGTRADEKARKLFLEVLDNSSSAQGALVNGIRRRIAQQQYELNSIPFEVLQNADDAATELLSHIDLDSQGTQFVKKFVLHRDAEGINFFYGGRPINDACGQTGASGDRWRRDLVKMLLLNGSDKNTDGENQATGKFGLGFKSVFLLSSQPKVASAALDFEIVGGIWPRPLTKDDLDSMQSAGDEHFGDFPKRTIIQLGGDSEKIEQAVARFQSLAPWLPIFTRSLRTIVYSCSKTSTAYRWQASTAEHSERLRLGRTASGPHGDQHLEITDGEIQWLFGIENGRIAPLPEAVPWLWVTAPTREPGIGLALNAPFALDPGRTRLSKHHEDVSTTNHELFYRAARLAREEFSKLAQTQKFAVDVGLAQPLIFWSSLWKVLTKIPRSSDQPEGPEHLSKALWPNDLSEGYARLIKDHRVLPTGLPLPLEGLTSLSQLRHAVNGWLATSTGCRVLKAAIENQLVAIKDESECCSESVALELRSRLLWTLTPFGLPNLLRGTHETEHRVDPSLTLLIAEALFVGKDEQPVTLRDVLSAQELREIENLAESLRFLSASGTWEAAGDLVATAIQNAEKDESKRSAFAPPDRVLSPRYSSEAARLFTALRPKLRADSKLLAEWTRQTASKAALQASLLYLATGDLRQEMAMHLGPVWMKEISDDATYLELDSCIRDSIALVFGIAEKENRRRLLQGEAGCTPLEEDECDATNPIDEHVPLSAEDIFDAWDPIEALQLFTLSGPLRNLVIPQALNDEDISNGLREAGSLNGKATWYRLLCLGCTLGIPRGRRPASEVVHIWNGNLGKDFWEHTIPASMSDLSKDSFKSKLDAFFKNVVDRYYTSENATGEDAEFWRRVFYDFRKMHHFVFHNHLPETILEFAEFPESDGERLIKFLRSGHIPDDMRDPTTKRFRGVIGQSMKTPLLFMMRELRRLGIINHQFDEACYYMNSPARRVAFQMDWITSDERIGGDFSGVVELSKKVQVRMKAELGELSPHFDLPLQLYAHKHSR
jgi:hypothetical protein